MAPTTVFRTWPKSTTVEQVNTPAERLGTITSESIVSDSGSNQLDLGIIDISGGTANSVVEHMFWHVSADDGNTLVEDFGLWSTTAQEGWDQAGTLNKVQPLMGDEGTPGDGLVKYVINAVTGDYASWVTVGATEGAETVLRPTDRGTTMALSTNSDDVIFWAHYLLVAANETTGTYKDLDSGFEFQASFGYSYS